MLLFIMFENWGGWATIGGPVVANPELFIQEFCVTAALIGRAPLTVWWFLLCWEDNFLCPMTLPDVDVL